MKKTASFFYVMTIATAIGAPAIYAEDGICHRCEVIREQNKTEHRNYEYYEDFLKSEGKGQGQTSNAPVIKNTRSNTPSTSSAVKNNSKNNKNSENNNNNNNNNNNSNSNNNDQNNNSQNNNSKTQNR